MGFANSDLQKRPRETDKAVKGGKTKEKNETRKTYCSQSTIIISAKFPGTIPKHLGFMPWFSITVCLSVNSSTVRA